MHQGVCMCVCVQYISKRQKDKLSNTSLLQARFLTKKQLLCWILPIALPMPTLLPSLHYSLSWEAEKKNCICRLPDMLLQLCLDEWVHMKGKKTVNVQIVQTVIHPEVTVPLQGIFSLHLWFWVIGTYSFPLFFRICSSYISVFANLGFPPYFLCVFSCFLPVLS